MTTLSAVSLRAIFKSGVGGEGGEAASEPVTGDEEEASEPSLATDSAFSDFVLCSLKCFGFVRFDRLDRLSVRLST